MDKIYFGKEVFIPNAINVMFLLLAKVAANLLSLSTYIVTLFKSLKLDTLKALLSGLIIKYLSIILVLISVLFVVNELSSNIKSTLPLLKALIKSLLFLNLV